MTGLTDQQVRALLAAAMAYDNRRPGEANIAAWTEAAKRGRWTFDTALEAIHTHYAASADFVMPAHITAIIRAAMRQPEPFAELPPAVPASEETRQKVMDMVAELADKKRAPS